MRTLSKNKSHNDLVSVIVTCFNLGEYLDDALSSLRSQTYPHIEVIVLDDESTKVSTIRAFDRLEQKNPEFEFIRLSHRGVEELRNYGVKKSKGEYVCVMDADDVFDNNYLSRCVTYFKKNKDKSIVTTYVKLFGKEEGTWKTQDYDPTILFTQNVLHVSSVYKREVFDAVGGYDKQFRGYSDWEFWLHAMVKGYKWSLIPDELFLYRIRDRSMLGDAKEMDSEIYRSMLNKHGDVLGDHIVEVLVKYRNEFMKAIKFGNENIAKYEKSLLESRTRRTVLSRSNKKLTDSNKKLAGKIHEAERKLYHYEQERVRLTEMAESIGRSRYMHIRSAFLSARTIPGVLLLPFKVVYVFLPNRAKSAWRSVRQLLFVRLYKEPSWDSKAPLVSIVVTVFNYGAYVKEAIQSIEKQTFTDYEIVLIEGGSTDGTSPDVVRKIKGRTIRKFFRKGRHFAGDNRNFGINKARGKYVLCLDPDDLIEPTYVEKAVFIAETMKYDIVGCGIRAFGEADFTTIHPLRISLTSEIEENRIATVALFRKDMFQKVGGYKDWRKGGWLIHEDWEFWVRMMAHGARVYNIQEPLMHWRHHKANNSMSKEVPDIDFQRKFIVKANKEQINQSSEQASMRANSRVYLNIDPLRNVKRSIDCGSPGIFFGIPYFDYGGADKLYQEVEKEMSRDFQISVITSQELLPERTSVIEGHRKITDRIYNLPKLFPEFLGSSIQSYLFTFFLRFLLHQHKPSYLYQGGSDFIYRILPRIKKWCDEIIVVDNQFNTGKHFESMKKKGQHIDIIVAQNNETYRLAKSVNKGSKDVRIIKTGVNLNDFQPCRKKSDLEELRIPKGMFVVSFMGRMSEEKNPDMFIEIAENIKDDTIYFVMAGDGPLFRNIQEKVHRNRKLQKKFCLPGFVTSSQSVFAVSDVFVVPSCLDGYPYAILESLASGVPVIASRVGGIPEMLPPKERIGFLCDSNSVSCFCKRIKELKDNPSLLREYKINARRFAEDNLGTDQYLGQWRELFRKEV